MRGILGPFRYDAVAFILPAILGLGLAQVPTSSPFALPVLFFAFILIDSGHVYTTLWRTWFSREERASHPIYLWLPAAVLVASLAIAAWDPRVLGLAFLYATIFHNVRQFYGIQKWYQKLNRSYSQTSDCFLYAVCALPVVALHLRSDFAAGDRGLEALPMWPKPEGVVVLMIFEVFVLAAWLLFEFRRDRQGHGDLNRASVIAVAAVLYGYGGFWAPSAFAALVPLVLVHGVSYGAIMARSLKATRWSSWRMSAITAVLLATALLGGLSEWILEDDVFGWFGGGPLPSWFVALGLAPGFLHYIIDGHIWTGRHREAAAIFG